MLDHKRRLPTLDPNDPRSLLSREAQLRENDAWSGAEKLKRDAIEEIQRRCAGQSWDHTAKCAWSAACMGAGLTYLKVLLREYMKLGKEDPWLREQMRQELSQLGDLSELEREAVWRKLSKERSLLMAKVFEPPAASTEEEPRVKRGRVGRPAKKKRIDGNTREMLELLRGTKPKKTFAGLIGISYDQYQGVLRTHVASDDVQRAIQSYLKSHLPENTQKKDLQKLR